MSEVRSSILLLGFLVLLPEGLKQFTVGKEGFVGELLLVLLPDPVPGFVVPHCMLQEHCLQGLLHFYVGEFSNVDKWYDSCAEGMYTFLWELPDIKK